MTWNLHVVASPPIEDVNAIATDIAKVVTDAGHDVVSIVLTTDAGSQDVTPAPEPEPVEEPASPTPEPAPAEPEAPVA